MKKENKRGALWRLLKEARSIRWYLLLACFLVIIIIACGLVIPELSGDLVQELIDYPDKSNGYALTRTMLPGLELLGLAYGLKYLLSYLKMLVMNTSVSRYFTCNLRIMISDKLQRLPMKYVDNTPVGDILSRMTQDVSTIGNSLHSVIDTIMVGFVQMIAIAIMLFLENYILALVVLVFTPLSIWLSTFLSKRSRKYFRANFKQSGELYSVVEESYTNYATTKAYNLEQDCGERHSEINHHLAETFSTANFLSGIVQPIISAINSLVYIAITLVGGWLVVRKGADVGVIVTVILYAREFSSPLEQIANGISSLQQAGAAAGRVVEVLDMEEEAPISQTLPDSGDGSIDFKAVDFSYSPNIPLIRNFSVHVEKGQHIAIVGPTGAGKTTLVNLLMRFYDLNAGEICIGGRPMADYSRESTREKFGMVLQDTWLFGGTIAENLAYGRPGATREEIERCCKEAYCDHFIRTLPQGYDTVVGSDTATLSVGQKQLLTIARALLADKEFLILDEATSNVDTRTEILIQKAMDKLMHGRTCFIIAHRLSTIVDADRILVIRDGQIVEQGKHAELLAAKGFYHQIYTSQYAI